METRRERKSEVGKAPHARLAEACEPTSKATTINLVSDLPMPELVSIASLVQDAVVTTDADGLVQFMNPAAEVLLASRLSELRSKPLPHLFAIDGMPDSQADLFDPVRAHVLSGGEAGVQLRLRERNMLVECRGAALFAEKKFSGLVLMCRAALPDALAAESYSVERLLASADALFEEKERAQVTLNCIGDAVISTDFRGRVSYLNIVAEQMTGWTQSEASGRALDDIFPLIDVVSGEPISNPTVRAIIENRTVGLEFECVLVQRNGGRIAVEDSATPIHDRHGAVIGAVMVAHDVTVSRELSQKLTRLALHDNLTDVPNRGLLNDRLAQAIERARRDVHSVALLYVDLDRFKQINDSLGHSVGDQVLQSTALRLLACVRSTDTVSRHGGDEFVVLLSEIMHPDDAVNCAQKMIRALEAPYLVGSHSLQLTASIGIATFPADAGDADALIRNADVAMYQAKASGRNNFQRFKAEMNTRPSNHQSLESDLRRAIERRELLLHYQPQVNLQSGAIVGVEALIRWLHPVKGVLAPGDFISVAEDSGLIVPIGHWVMEKVCQQVRSWLDGGLAPISVAINVSAAELRATAYIIGIRDIISKYGLASSIFEIELSKTCMMQDGKSTAEVLRSLKDFGVRIAFSDFGSGYFSLRDLKRFPIDTLKIDQSFVRDMAADPDGASIVNAVINMGRSLHMNVVAEGIENQQQLVSMQEHLCPEGQGFYFCPPLPSAQLTQLLHDFGSKPAFADKANTRRA